MGAALGRAIARGLLRCGSPLIVALALTGLAGELRAQNIISVPFTNGFIGTRGSNAGEANTVLTYATLGIARTFFIQNSDTTVFQVQGNDIPGTLRIVRTNGTTLDVPALANWRNSGGTTYLIGILPQPTSPITFSYGTSSSIQITNGTVNGGTSVGAYVAAYGGTRVGDGASESGNAAQSQVLSGLNSYLTTVIAQRPAGPVTVTTLTTTSATPTLTGTATLGTGEALSIVVGGVQYTTSTSPAVVRSGNGWSLALVTPLALGTYNVAATVTDADGFTLSDATTDELVISTGGGPVTLGGSFTADGRAYDGTLAATGTTTGLTLTGVAGGHTVTIASVTLAFQTAAAGAGKPVVVTGFTLGGADAGLYTASLTNAPTTTANVTARPLTIGGVSVTNRTYDGTTVATLTGTPAYVGLATGETHTVTGTPTASFATAGVGTAKAVTVTGYTAPNANYSLTQPVGLTGAITASTITLSGGFTAADKSFDGTPAATITGNTLALQGVVTGETVTLTGLVATFATATVGAAKPVTLTAASLAGSTASNYTLSLANAPTTTAAITAVGGALTLGGSFAADDKTFDGTVAATGTTGALTLSGVQTGHAVTIAAVTLAFQSATVGTAKTVVIAGVTLGGADAGLYTVSLTNAPTATASITTAGGTVTLGGSFTANDRTYDGTVAATGVTAGLTLTGVAAGDQVTIAGVTLGFQAPTVGAGRMVVVTGVTLGGAHGASYAVSLTGSPTATAAITARPITIGGSFAVADKVADGSAAATITTEALTLLGGVAGEALSLTGLTASFADALVGTGKPVTLGAATLTGATAANYALSLVGAPTTIASITAAGGAVTIAGSFTASDKTHDGTVAATGNTAGLTLAGVQPGHTVGIASVTLAFQSPNVGAGKTVVVSVVTLGGPDAGRYTVNLAGAPTAMASITSAGGTVTVAGSFTASDKPYDGTTAATGVTSGLTLVGVTAPDQVTITGVTLAFASPGVGAARTVVVTGVTLGGPDAARYTAALAGAPTAQASITPRPVTVGGSFTAADKLYDGTSPATITSTALALLGALAGQDVTLTGAQAAFADAAVGAGKRVALTALRLTGTAAGNYVLSLAGAPATTASILPATPPGAPRTVVATAGDGRLTVTWTSPALEGCRAVTGYVVEVSADQGRSWTRAASVPAGQTSLVIPGLVNHVAHQVRVAAVNACGHRRPHRVDRGARARGPDPRRRRAAGDHAAGHRDHDGRWRAAADDGRGGAGHARAPGERRRRARAARDRLGGRGDPDRHVAHAAPRARRARRHQRARVRPRHLRVALPVRRVGRARTPGHRGRRPGRHLRRRAGDPGLARARAPHAAGQRHRRRRHVARRRPRRRGRAAAARSRPHRHARRRGAGRGRHDHRHARRDQRGAGAGDPGGHPARVPRAGLPGRPRGPDRRELRHGARGVDHPPHRVARAGAAAPHRRRPATGERARSEAMIVRPLRPTRPATLCPPLRPTIPLMLRSPRGLVAAAAATALAACGADEPLRPAGAEPATVTLTTASAVALASLGDTALVHPRVIDRAGAALAGVPLRWSLSRSGVVEADGEGVYRAVGNGRVTIVAELDPAHTGVRPGGYWAGRLADSVVVEVRQRPARLTLAPVDTAFGTLGARRQLRALVTDARGHALLDGPPPLTWRSADPRVLAVDSTGLVRSLGDGVTHVAVEAATLRVTATFSVNARRPHTSCMVFAQRRQSRQSCVTLDFVVREREDGR
jgi:hypothetical protein